MNKAMLLMLAAALTACGPSQPSETVDALVASPERIKEIQRQCKEDRANCHDPVGSPWMMEDTGGVRANTGRGRSTL